MKVDSAVEDKTTACLSATGWFSLSKKEEEEKQRQKLAESQQQTSASASAASLDEVAPSLTTC